MKKRNKLTSDQILTAEAAYERTAERKQYIQSRGYSVIKKWTCEVNREED